MKQRKRLYDKAKSSQAPEDWAAYHTIKNEITADINTLIQTIKTDYSTMKAMHQELLEVCKTFYKKTMLELAHYINGKVLVNGAEKAD